MNNLIPPKITNMVIKFVLDLQIDLSFLQFVFSNVDYRPQRFNGAIVKDFGCTLLVFRNGKINVLGVKEIENAVKAIKSFCECLDAPYTCKEMEMVNLVACAALGKKINLARIASDYKDLISYRPEIYPAAYYTNGKKEKPKVLIFHTGKLVFTGFKSFTHVNLIYSKIKNLLD